MKKMISSFYQKYRDTPRNVQFIDTYIIFTFFHLVILTLYAYFSFSFGDKISHAAIFTAIGNLTFLMALRVQLMNKRVLNLKREKLIFDFVLCTLVLYIGVFSYMHLN
ncbi:dolichyl-diphosphooligosaccharide--protein glycosyltransferase subunit DAD1, putative [Plasmodium ovale]|uniref:Dolichyl-diphosphooligosaccharide--protein glycosyltransferase subunit OST2 n=1 Tax=Plasmodium ovale TaxID=36330 RepID=A0A1D3KWW2_PLAOA|nr:dolichyl-diphosphooligosaccharide--protein glycosyltransferase subunit DAD1, putative [Plasmodium ovale]